MYVAVERYRSTVPNRRILPLVCAADPRELLRRISDMRPFVEENHLFSHEDVHGGAEKDGQCS